MRKLIVAELVSIDGVMEAPGGEPDYAHTGWAVEYMGPEQVDYKLHEALEAESLLLGRVTYESFAEGWSEGEGQFAEKMNAMPKHVVSTTLKSPRWNATVIGDSVVGRIADLRQANGGPILVAGSRSLVHTLMEHDLVDEYRFTIFPFILGSGRRIFPESPRRLTLRLIASRPFENGVVVNTYVPG